MDTAGNESEDRVVVLPTTEIDGPETENEEAAVTEEQWAAMKDALDHFYNYRDEEGHDPSKVFHKRVNRRNIPGYYDVIKEPMAFSNLKQSCLNREYKAFQGFVRDCALIWHNAHTYNRPDAGAYKDATTIKGVMEERFRKLVEQKIIDEETAVWPDLGEIPPVEDVADEDEDEEEEGDVEGEDDDEDDEADESDEDVPRSRRQRPGRPRRDHKSEGAIGEPETKKRRGRPPKVDTPMEARIKNVLKGIRKPKNDDGVIMIHSFEKLPDKAAMPEYYSEIKAPIAIEQIKKNQKRKRYTSVDHFMKDIDLMFENAKLFNEDESQIYKDAVALKAEAHKIAEIEKRKTDDEFVMEEGRKPRPGGITHNDELWKVGDWVHIRNANDISKPIVAQIYRTWEDASGSEWVNACWYYRPEQTVHQYEKHFLPNEVVKTGQYRDHPIEDVIDRCFVMFFTRYSRGRPRGIKPGSEVYVCEARYNEEKYKMNKIKTWASCLPDEVRDKDYEMDMFDGIRKVKKVPSPLLHLLKDDAKENEPPPKPRWGAENAPPVTGGIYKAPRDENQSPPPEPTPSPPPQPPPPPPRQATQTPNHDNSAFRRASELLEQAGKPFGQPPEQTINSQQPSSSYSTQPRHYSQSAASPAPQQYQQQTQSQQQASYNMHSQPLQPTSYQQSTTQSYADYATPQQNRYQQTQRYPQLPPQPMQGSQRSEDVYILPDSANLQIPEEVRNQMRCDENGHVLFFTKPPFDPHPPITDGAALGHSLKYKAAKIRRTILQKQRQEEEEAHAAQRPVKRSKTIAFAKQTNQADMALFESAIGMPFEKWVEEMNGGTEQLLKSVYGEEFEAGKRSETRKIAMHQKDAQIRAQTEAKASNKKRQEQIMAQREMWKAPKVYLDDVDPRY